MEYISRCFSLRLFHRDILWEGASAGLLGSTTLLGTTSFAGSGTGRRGAKTGDAGADLGMEDGGAGRIEVRVGVTGGDGYKGCDPLPLLLAVLSATGMSTAALMILGSERLRWSAGTELDK
jgi:hypothetical protein